MIYRNWVSVFLIKNRSSSSHWKIGDKKWVLIMKNQSLGGKLDGWGGSFLMVYRNNAGRLGACFISVCLETRWLGHFGGLYVPG